MSAISGRRPGIGLWRMVSALVRQRRRLLLATVAVALAVGYLAGALTLLDRVSQGLDRLAAAGAERADLIVEGEVAYESALEQTRRLVPSSVAPSLEGIPGIAAVSPRLEEVTVILGADGEPVVSPGLSEQPLGSNWPEDDQMSPYQFVGDGRAPEDSDEVVIDERSATAAGIEVGDQVVIVGKGEPRSYEVVGIVTTSQGGLPEGSSLALFTTDEARSLFESPDNDNRVAIRLEPDADPEQVAAAVRAVLPAGAEVVDGATGAQHRQESITRSFTLVRVLITGFALLALVVGMVTVANSLTLLYAERRRTFAGLRLVGAHQRQLLAAALVEAAALAAVASLLGVPLGLLLARLIEGAVGALGTSIPVGGSVVSVPALVGAVVIGTVATVLAAIVPAVRACRVAPIEAVADSPAAARVPWSVRIANAALVGVGAIVLLAGLMMLGDVSATTALAAAVAVVLVGGVLAFLPTVLSLAVAAGIRLVPTRPAALSRIGARDAVRNRSRTAATTGALLLATAVVAGLAVFLASFASSVDGDVGRLVRSDLVVDSGTFTRGGLPTELLAELDDLPEVAAVSGWQVGRVTIAQLPLRITGVDGAVVDQVLDPAWTEDSGTRISPSGIALDASTAESLGVRIGDSVPVMFTSGGVEQLTLEGTYTQGSLLLGEAMIDRATLLRQVPASVDIAALVALTDDDPEDVAAVEQVAADYGVDAVLRPSEFVDARSELLNGFQRVIQWMLLFTLLQALVGVVNTLLLSVGERRREFGLLRVTGASRRQLMRLVLVEGLSFAVVGTALGLAVGVGGAILAVRSLGQYGISTIDVPAGVLVVTAAAAMLLGVAAAVAPARWASSVPPLEAVADAGGDRGSRRRTRRGTSGAAPPAAVVSEAGAPPALTPEAVPPPFPTLASVPPPFPSTASAPVPTIASVPPPFPSTASAPVPTIASAPPPFPSTASAPPPTPPFPSVEAVPSQSAPAATLFGSATLLPPTPSASPPPASPPPARAAPPLLPAPNAPPPASPVAAPLPAPPAEVAATPTQGLADPGSAEQVLTPPLFATESAALTPGSWPAPTPIADEAPSPESAVPPAPPSVPAAPVPPVSPVAPVPQASPVEAVAPPTVPTFAPAASASPVEPETPSAPPPSAPAVPAPAEPPRGRAAARGEAGRAAEGWVRPASPPRGGAASDPAPPPVFGRRPAAQDAAEQEDATNRPGAAVHAPLDGAVRIRLGEAVDRLDPLTVREAGAVLTAFARELGPDERIEHLAQGWTKGLMCLVARTDRRVVVIVDRFPEPLVESLHRARTAITVYGPPGTDRVSLAVVDGRRLLELTGVRDRAEAAALAGTASRADTVPEYF